MITTKQRNKLIDLVRAREQRSFDEVKNLVKDNPSGFFDEALEMLNHEDFKQPKLRCGLLRVMWFLRAVDHDNCLFEAIAKSVKHADVEIRSHAARLAIMIANENKVVGADKFATLVQEAKINGLNAETEEFLKNSTK